VTAYGYNDITNQARKVLLKIVLHNAYMVTGVCPKCGKKGYQNIHHDRKDSPRQYLEYVHISKSGQKSSCHIGRVRTSGEALEEFNEET